MDVGSTFAVALCTDDPNLWFSSNPAERAKARSICGNCPSQSACAALAGTYSHGIWGGLDASGRPARDSYTERERVRDTNRTSILDLHGAGVRAVDIAERINVGLSTVHAVVSRLAA